MVGLPHSSDCREGRGTLGTHSTSLFLRLQGRERLTLRLTLRLMPSPHRTPFQRGHSATGKLTVWKIVTNLSENKHATNHYKINILLGGPGRMTLLKTVTRKQFKGRKVHCGMFLTHYLHMCKQLPGKFITNMSFGETWCFCFKIPQEASILEKNSCRVFIFKESRF